VLVDNIKRHLFLLAHCKKEKDKKNSPPCLVAQRQVVQKHSARESKCSNGTWGRNAKITHKTHSTLSHTHSHTHTRKHKPQKKIDPPTRLPLTGLIATQRQPMDIYSKELPKSTKPPSAIRLRTTPVSARSTHKTQQNNTSTQTVQSLFFVWPSVTSFCLAR
jgi:hypothetical protein